MQGPRSGIRTKTIFIGVVLLCLRRTLSSLCVPCDGLLYFTRQAAASQGNCNWDLQSINYKIYLGVSHYRAAKAKQGNSLNGWVKRSRKYGKIRGDIRTALRNR
ncbi:hypothetical protein FRC20_005649 [Serendipita sp. 405]|nr:hypothetical protein FRC16_002086 [Serendipita sp. 398]KAG8840302.1 hypothetical protein FRC20_005649 [Serendipita sp. 405]